MSKLDKITKLMSDKTVYKYFTLSEIGKNLGILEEWSVLNVEVVDSDLEESEPDFFDEKDFKVAVDKDGNILTDGTNNFKEILGDQYTWLFNEK
jgi:hypothetical protein